MAFNTTPISDPQVFCPIFNHKIADGLCWDISNIGNDSSFWKSAGLQNRKREVRCLQTVPSQRAVRTLPTTEHGRRTVSPNRGFTNRKEFFHHEA